MKSLLAGLLLLACVTNANAAYINNGDNTITNTTTGLQWLALSQTVNMTFTNALNANVGWRYATNTEVNTMFYDFFPSFVANNSLQYQTSVSASDIALATEFFTIFEGVSFSISKFTYGLYRDENSSLRMAGTLIYGTSSASLYGPDFAPDYSGYENSLASSSFGTYLVKSASVPEASAIYLFAFGLLGLLGVARRKV